MKVSKDINAEELIRVAQSLFFPNDESPKGLLSDMELDMRDFVGRPLDNKTVGDLYQELKIKLLRLYVHTKTKVTSRPLLR